MDSLADQPVSADQDLAPFLGVKPLGEGRRTDDVGEHDRDRLSLTLDLVVGRLDPALGHQGVSRADAR